MPEVDKQCMQILESVEIMPFEGNIQLCIDKNKNLYEVPVFLINQP